MDARTYVSAQAGLSHIRECVSTAQYNERGKERVATDNGMLALLDEIVATVDTIKAVIAHDREPVSEYHKMRLQA